MARMSYPPSPTPYSSGPLAGPPPNHPKSTTVLVLGILSLVACSILGPFAWIMGNRTVAEIDASNGQLGGRDTANIGRILGIVASVLLVLLVLFLIVMVVLTVFVAGTSSTNNY